MRIAPRGRVNAVAPGWTYSPMTRGELDEEFVARLSRTMALRKVAVADDVARAVVVLASDELSGHVTGELVTVAGGMEGRTVHERMSRFEERLASETPIVADGGMGALLSSAVAGLRCPEEANLRAAESVLEVHLGYIHAGAELIETNTLRSEPGQARAPVPRRRARGDQRRRGAHRARGARGRRP